MGEDLWYSNTLPPAGTLALSPIFASESLIQQWVMTISESANYPVLTWHSRYLALSPHAIFAD